MATDIYISPQGSDSNPGSIDLPLKTLKRAKEVISQSGALGNSEVNVILREGTYYLEKPLSFSSSDSGTDSHPVTFSSHHDEKVIISGGLKLDLEWSPFRDGIWKADTPAGCEMDQLFINGKRQHMARYPNFNSNIKPYGGYASDAFSSERATKWKDPTGGYIHAIHSAHWGGYHYLITGKNADGSIAYEGGWQNNRQMGMHEEYRFVENIFEELDSPEEWYHDTKNSTLYYFPTERTDLSRATVEIARLPHLIEFSGTEAESVKHIHLKGLIFRHSSRTFMLTKEPLLRSDWTIYRGGAIRYEGAEDCSIENCEFDQMGGNAVFVNQFNRNLKIKGCHIHGAGASGVCFVGNPDSVRNPLFEYSERQHYQEIDKTPGPKTNDFPSDCTVEDCLIHDIGTVEKQATGIQVSMSKSITIRHCSIYDVGRAGINFSEGTFGGHLIEFCDVFDTVLETSDHGSFNSWGRDRYWELEGIPDGEADKLALLDTAKSVIRNSRWRCDHGWDIDLDDGSSCYEIYNNLMLNKGLKLREGFFRKAYNNIAPCGTLHPHVWYPNSQDEVTGNIWSMKYRQAGMKHWDAKVDHNFFSNEEDRKAFEAQGCDLNSFSGNPLFSNPSEGDFSLSKDSPALRTGFQNFPMDQFGVQRPCLKEIARVPDFPNPKTGDSTEENSNSETEWLGGKVRNISGEEFSAFGTRKEDGGVHICQVPESSKLYLCGFRNDDLIQKVDKKRVKSVQELIEESEKLSWSSIEIEFVRGQALQKLSLS